MSIASFVLDLNAAVKVIHVRREQDLRQAVLNAAAAYNPAIVKTPTHDQLHAYPVNPSALYSYEEGCFFSRVVEKMFIHKEGYRLNHETRVIRDADGTISESTRQAYLKRMME